MKLGIIAGEASGDFLGAQLIEALAVAYPHLEVEGIAGPQMQAAGCKSLFDMERLAVMGLIEPLCRLPDLIRLRKSIYQHFLHYPPDVFIGIDAPDFNLGLEKKLRASGIPVIHYVSPSVWAWRAGRVKLIKQAVDMILCLFPFEAAFYTKHHVPVRYVGHPLAAKIPLQPDSEAARRTLGLSIQHEYVALLPGSRLQEIERMSPVFLKAAEILWKEKPSLHFISAHLNQGNAKRFQQLQAQFTPDLPLVSFVEQTATVMAAADIAMVTSGTATLECMLYKKPMVIAYRMAPLTYFLAKYLVKTPYIGLPNILANTALVPEFIQEAATPQALASALLAYMNHPEKISALKQAFTSMHQNLHQDTEKILVEAVVEVLKK